MFKFITRRPFIVNLIVAIALVCAVFAIFFMSLAGITHHSDIKKVPDVVGKPVDEAVQVLKNAGLDVAIQDSVYYDSIPKSSIVLQKPDADAAVKEGRTVYLTVNRAQAPLIEMPDLRGFSITSAQLLLQSLGLKLAGTKYVADIAKNAVKSQLFNNAEIAPGTRIPAGSAVFLVLGNGAGSETLDVPNLLGMTLGEARDYVTTFNVAIGGINADPDVTDQENAFVYRQSPGLNDGAVRNKMHPGQPITVWLSVEPKNGSSSAKPADSTGNNAE